MNRTLSIILVMSIATSASAQQPVAPGTITNLYDAFGKPNGLTKDFGFSCIIEYQGKVILFDAGSNADIFKHNCEAAGVDLTKVDLAIISHAHFDHLNGIDHLLKLNPQVKLYFPRDGFWGAPVPFDATGQEAAVADSLPLEQRYFEGGPTKFTIAQSGRFWGANIEFVSEDKEVLPGVRLIATSSPYLGYWSRYPGRNFAPGALKDDHAQGAGDAKLTELAELSLSLATSSGDVLIVGCSHSGVENIVADAKAFTGSTIRLLYGGYHLLPFDRPATLALTHHLKDELGVKQVAPAHCTGHLAFRILSRSYGSDYRFAGLGESIAY